MDEIVLNASPRTIIRKRVKALRREGQVPMVVYGQIDKPVSLQANLREVLSVIREAGGSRLITIKYAGKTQVSLAREVQRDPVTDQILHLDLLAVSMTQRITVEIPLVLEGESPALAGGDAVVITGLNSIQIEALPGDLINQVMIDVSELTEIGDQISVRDLIVPDTVNIMTSPDEMVARITYVTIEEEEEEVVEEELEVIEGDETGEPEVIAKGKAEEGKEDAS